MEQSAAAAESLKEQALQLAGLVTGFKVGGPTAEPSASRIAEQVVTSARQSAGTSPAVRAAAAPVASAAPRPTADQGEWETF